MVLQVILVFAIILLMSQGNGVSYTKDKNLRDNCYHSAFDSVCWKAKDYPLTKITEMLDQSEGNYLNTFGRFNSSHSFETTETSCNLCNTDHNFKIAPLVLNEGGKKFFVVNTDKYRQTIAYHICSGNQTRSICLRLELSQSQGSGCQQKMTMIRLLCYDPEEEKFVAKVLNYPSSCVCALKLG